MDAEKRLQTTPKTPLILDIKGNSLDDGPGIRTVVFFKGCPLSCVWCHNPESKRAAPEISFDRNECVGCDTCIQICPEKALDRNNPFFIDRTRCTLCNACVINCPSGALSMVGREMTVEEIVAFAAKDKPFFENSGGGVTLSGGEPTLHMDFLSGLLNRFKAEGIHTLVETCGLFDFSAFADKILPWVDSIYYDIKLYDPDAHRNFCGVKNDRILKNFSKLNTLSTSKRFELLPRTPLIPDITATEKNLTQIAEFLADQGVRQTRLLGYNPLWHEKNEKIGIQNSFKNQKEMTAWMPKEKIETCRAIFTRKGIHTG
ncbi:MAG: glycyl radical-activating protein [Desulfobacterales bacterium CG23_combo_of_CG06-09_8_20_14_all_51_8]|nr:MAG: glycyl radical-activating protein [Desulfobacterales bacterium CG23_combo_of_CG06-09_8_20_14_all_51_8]